MTKAVRWLSTSGVFVVLGVIACSSSSGGGGGGSGTCGDMSGSWSMGGDCSSGPTSCTVTQNGCTATLSCNTGNATASVNGNKLSFAFGSAQCSGSVTNGTFTGSCTESGQTCSVNGSCSSGSCGAVSGSGGAGGTSGSGGSGAAPPGGSGGGTSCGGVNYSSDPGCQGCMESACCSQLSQCAPGTPCDQLLNCYIDNCLEAPDGAACLSQFCSAYLSSGGPAARAMYDCDEAHCMSQCGSGEP